jgi:hypothetical protein
MYDFKNMRAAVTHYFVRSYSGQVNAHHLRSWVVEASDDGQKWNEIDRREDCDELNGPNRSRVFDVRSIVEARFVRLRQIGLDWAGCQHIIIEAFELFGGLRIRDSMKPN